MGALDLTQAGDRQILEQLACDDQEESVRVAAVAYVSDAALLNKLLGENSGKSEPVSAQSSTSAKVVAAANLRLESLLVDSALSEQDANLFLNTDDKQRALVFANHSAIESLRKKAIDSLGEETDLLNVVQKSRFHDARLTAASKLKQHDNIRAALTACKTRDKVVAKQMQLQLDQKAAEEAAHIAAVQSVTTNLESMQALAAAVWSPQTASKRTALVEKWHSIDSGLTASSQAQFSQAEEKVQALIDAHDAEQNKTEVAVNNNDVSASGADIENSDANTADNTAGATTVNSSIDNSASDKKRPSESKAASSPTPLPMDDELTALLDSVAAVKPDGLVAFTEQHKEVSGEGSKKLISHIAAVAVMFDPPYDLSKGRPQALAARIKRVKTLLDTDNLLPGLSVKSTQYVQELDAHHEALTNRLDKAKQESADRIKATHRQFAALSGIVAEGKWGPASSMFRRLQKKVNAMETGERATLSDKLARAEKQLDEMADWQDFASRPKLEALCTEMENLPAKELKPEALAKEIKKLQANWKSLGVSRAANELWSRFKDAGDLAYEPCRSHFEQKQSERDTKLQTKAKVCDQLQVLHEGIEKESAGWENVEWKKIQSAVNHAKRDWSRNRIQDRKPDVALEKRFSEVLKPLEEKLATQYEANALLKQELVDKIQKLADADINQHSANQAKRLQSAWKQVGIMRRKDDQALWDVFNGHCRTIFKHQHAAEREKYQASMSHVFRAKDIIKALKQIAKSKTYEEQKIQALQTEFLALEEFPEKDKKFLKRDFRAAMDACGKLQESAAKRRVQVEKEEIARLVELCEQLESAVEMPSSAGDLLKDDVVQAWDASEASLSRDISAKLVARRDTALQHLENGTQYDYEKAEAARRELLIRMEIMADKETPAEDKALRMQYQLAQLSEGMTSSSVVDKRVALSELEQQWYAANPVKQSAKDAFQSRFLAIHNR